jgi:hypothetical protein
LGFGPDSDALDLALAIEGASFSERGKQSLLGSLTNWLQRNGLVKEHLRSVLVTLLPRYFLEDSGTKVEGLTPIQKEVLFGFVSEMPKLDGLAEAIKSGVPGSFAQQLQTKLSAIASDTHVRADARQRAREFLALISAP